MNLESPKIKEKAETIEQRMQRLLRQCFNENQDSKLRHKDLLKRLQFFLTVEDNPYLDTNTINEIDSNLERICLIDNEEEFLNNAMVSLQPLFDWQHAEPVSFESSLRKGINAMTGFIPLNEMLTYEQKKTEIHIHLSPSETLSLGNKLTLLRDGFKKLAEILKDNSSIEQVRATSWLVAAHPGLLEKLGFTVEGEISPEMKKENFSHDDRPVASAFINREDLLRIYN